MKPTEPRNLQIAKTQVPKPDTVHPPAEILSMNVTNRISDKGQRHH